MIRYQESTNENIGNYNTILKALNREVIPDEKVWEIAKLYNDIPNFDNILYRETFEEIIYGLEKEYGFLSLEITYEANERASWLCIDEQEINNWSDCKNYFDKLKREL